MTLPYVKSITIPGTVRSLPIDLAIPYATANSYVINVLCGQNNTGKSYTLEGLRKCLQLRWNHTQESKPHTKTNQIEMDPNNGLHNGDIYVTMTSRSPQPLVLFFGGSTWRYMSEAGSITLTRNPMKMPTHRVSYAELFSCLVYEQMKSHIDLVEFPTVKDWIEKPGARHQVLIQLKANDTLYKCGSSDDVFNVLENVLGGYLYFRYIKVGNDSLGQIDFCLVYGDGSSRVYSEWSDGQRAVFYFLMLIKQVNPDILLLDEIENHLHPAYISDVLSFIKKNIAQSIITTHHPHVIFSELVDKAVYIEAVRPAHSSTPAKEIDYVKKYFQGSPQRTFFTLDTSFAKLAAVYKLFAHYDKQLLLQSQRVLNDSEVTFYTAITDIFSNGLKKASAKNIPDSQSKQLVNALKKLGLLQNNHNKAVILDIGSGYGRTEREISKLSLWQLGGTIDWICWEMNPSDRQVLRDQLINAEIPAMIPDSFEDISNSSVDVCTLVNVLHHLTPESFSKVILDAISKTVLSGSLVILELYPLLSAEKYAVQYAPERLVSIFRQLDLLASYELISIRDASAYCLVVSGKQSEMKLNYSDDEISQIVEREWQTIMEDAIHGYAQRQAVNDYRGYRDLLQSLTTIGSICAWQQHIWKHETDLDK